MLLFKRMYKEAGEHADFASLSALQQVVRGRDERRPRPPRIVVSRAQPDEAKTGETDLLTSEGLYRPEAC